MKNWLIGGAVVFALVVGAVSFIAINALDDDDDKTAAALEDDGADAARCTEDAVDCDDTGGGAGLAICAEGVTDCNDIAVGENISNACIVDEPDCNDTPDLGSGSSDGLCDDPECRARVTETVFADLESRVDSTAGEITIVSAEAVEWPDSCLGVATADVVCAEVITPGFKVVLEQLGTQYEYHTDATGANVILID